ncbi:MAG: hypothetical protein PHG06_21650, partial [Parabacteroides sp.]|nr:hypothetical protein [Parabacteroides sp.]
MFYIEKKVKDKRVLNLIRQYLKSGIMEDGLVKVTEEGTPQGGLCRARHNPPYAELCIMLS